MQPIFSVHATAFDAFFQTYQSKDSHIKPRRIPGGFCQPQASLQNTARNTAPTSMRSLLHLQAANQALFNVPGHYRPRSAARQ
jgi:hypothetical protein